MRSWLKGQDLQVSCHWGGKKKNWKEKKKIKTNKEMFYRFSLPPTGPEANVFAGIWCQAICHCIAHCHQDRFSQLGPCRVTLWASSSWAQYWGICNKLQCCWSHLPSAWLDDQTDLWSSCYWHIKFESRIKAAELLPQLKTHYLVVFQNSCDFCSGAASQFDIPWQPWCLSQQVAWSATEELAQWWHYEQPVLSWAN